MEEGSGEMGKGDVLREESTEWLTAAVGGGGRPTKPNKPQTPSKTPQPTQNKKPKITNKTPTLNLSQNKGDQG